MGIDSSSIFNVVEEAYVYRPAGEESLFYPVDDSQQDAIIVLDDIGTEIFKLAQSGLTYSEIVDACTKNFGIERERAESDAFHFFNHLKNLGAVSVRK